MTGGPQFTLITSTLNSGITFDRCLRSVESQQHASIEHLIVDGGSTDNTLQIVEQFRDSYPVRVVCSEPDTGIYQAWNRGVARARGQWLFFLGSDDFLIGDDVFSRVADSLKKNPALRKLRFLYGDTVASQERPDWRSFNPNAWHHWLRGVTEFPTSVFINAQLFAQGHRFDESYRICADHKFFAEHGLFHHSVYLPIPMISFQQGGISSNRDFERVHYLERRRMLSELQRPRPFFTEWYYWLRAKRFPEP